MPSLVSTVLLGAMDTEREEKISLACKHSVFRAVVGGLDSAPESFFFCALRTMRGKVLALSPSPSDRIVSQSPDLKGTIVWNREDTDPPA